MSSGINHANANTTSSSSTGDPHAIQGSSAGTLTTTNGGTGTWASTSIAPLPDPSFQGALESIEQWKVTNEYENVFSNTISIIKELEDRLKSSKQNIEELKVAIKEAKSLKFKEGDVVFHVQHGNCVISEIKPPKKLFIDRVVSENDSFYYVAYNKKGMVSFPVSEASGYDKKLSEAAELLYDK